MGCISKKILMSGRKVAGCSDQNTNRLLCEARR